MPPLQHPQHPSERIRLEKDLQHAKEAGSGQTITLMRVAGTELRKWTATVEIKASDYPNSVYQGGTFIFTITIPDKAITYPFRPPEIICNTKLYSPHVNPETGEVMFPELHEKNWSPLMDLHSIMSAFVRSLMQPEPAYAVNDGLAREYKHERHKLLEKAKEWTKLYAMKRQSEVE